jgi:hypothetical protein
MQALDIFMHLIKCKPHSFTEQMKRTHNWSKCIARRWTST